MTLISTACSWVNMFGGHKAAIFTQVGQFYFGRWVSFSSAVTVVDLPLGVLAAGILQRAAQAGKEHVAPHLCGPVPGLGEVDDVGFHEKA